MLRLIDLLRGGLEDHFSAGCAAAKRRSLGDGSPRDLMKSVVNQVEAVTEIDHRAENARLLDLAVALPALRRRPFDCSPWALFPEVAAVSQPIEIILARLQITPTAGDRPGKVRVAAMVPKNVTAPRHVDAQRYDLARRPCLSTMPARLRNAEAEAGVFETRANARSIASSSAWTSGFQCGLQARAYVLGVPIETAPDTGCSA